MVEFKMKDTLVTAAAVLSVLMTGFVGAAGECTVPTLAAAHAGDLAVFTTSSGTWRVKQEGSGYIWTLDENPGWSSAMACNNESQTKTVVVSKWTLLVPHNSCKFAQDVPPVQLSGDLIRSAIAAERWVPYSNDRAGNWPVVFNSKSALTAYDSSVYDPAGTNGTSNTSNIVGVISGQGGDYTTSRGSIDDADAEVIAKAVAGQEISRHTDGLYNIAFASAGYHYRTPFENHVLRDPQKPVAGIQYEYRIGGNEVTEEVESIVPLVPWRYDPHHLANSGWALWLGTEDPRIGMIIQSHAAFTLATYPEYLRVASMNNGHMDEYKCNRQQTRGIYNCLNSMWRARDVSRQVAANVDDVMLWSKTRMEEIYAETSSFVDGIMDEVTTAAAGPTFNYALKVTSAPFSKGYCATYQHSDGTNFSLISRSNFMDQFYGSVPAYLRATASEPLGMRLAETQGRMMVARTLYIGGAAGIDGRRDSGGSSYPIGICSKPGNFLKPDELPFDNIKGWAAWYKALDIKNTASDPYPPFDALNNVGSPNGFQTQFMLRATKQLVDGGKINPVEDINEAIVAYELSLSNTPANAMRFTIEYRHAAQLF